MVMTREPGRLYLVATPIGNLEDITLRALRILKEADVIAAEDTRHTIKLLNHYEIKKKMISYHQHNEREQSERLIQRMLQGENIALVSDAGMPGISDPGTILVAEAIRSGITVVPIPGPSAVISALSASGLDTSSFMFVGFLPRKKSEQVQRLRQIEMFHGTLVFYESPHRIETTLKVLREVLGNRQAVIARELTKVHEEFVRGELDSLLTKVAVYPNIGEFTILVSGLDENNRQKTTKKNDVEDIEVLFERMQGEGSSLKEELKVIAQKTGKPVKQIYRLYLERRKKQ